MILHITIETSSCKGEVASMRSANIINKRLLNIIIGFDLRLLNIRYN